MPLFDNHCPTCNLYFEDITRWDDPPSVCKHCNNLATRVLSAPAKGYMNGLNTRFVNDLLDRNGMSEYKD